MTTTTTAPAPAAAHDVSSETTPEFTVLIDGDCPLCKREAKFMQKLDKGRGRLCLVDITADDFDPTIYGRTMDDVMGSIHGVNEDGEVVDGMEVFRGAYRAVGLGWLLAPTGWPGLRPIFDALYRFFARYRLTLTGRSDAACEDGRCKVG